MIYNCYNSVKSNIATVINNTNVPIGECFRVSRYTKQSSNLFNGQNKESTYMDEEETIYVVSGRYLCLTL